MGKIIQGHFKPLQKKSKKGFRGYPATTMVEVKALIDPEMLIEVEADAVISS